MMPPLPMPWTVLPSSRMGKFCARQQMSVPAVKRMIEAMNTERRPNAAERAPSTGWKVELVKRYEVPVQKASLVEPWRSFAMVCITSKDRYQRVSFLQSNDSRENREYL